MSKNEVEKTKASDYLKYGNISLVAVFSGACLIKFILFPMESSIGFNIFALILLVLFMVPYLLCIRAFSPNRKKKAAIVTSIIWCILIIIGVTSVQQQYFVNVACALLFSLSLVNIFFLTKMSRKEKLHSS